MTFAEWERVLLHVLLSTFGVYLATLGNGFAGLLLVLWAFHVLRGCPRPPRR